MKFSHLIGNERAKQYLAKMLKKKAVGHSLLFAGPSGVGKRQFAKAFALELLGSESHPDLRIFRPEGKSGLHSIESMREMCESVYLAPFKGCWKIFIIEDADRMLATSANALLKTFEEPSFDTIIILITHHLEHLLPTVLSRCRTVYFQAIDEDLIQAYLQEKGVDQAKKIAKLSRGSLGVAYDFVKNSTALREELLNRLALGEFKDYFELLNFSKKIAEMVEKVEEIESSSKDLSALQKQRLIKEGEGFLRMQKGSVVYQTFLIIYFWYRDLVLLQSGGAFEYIEHKDRLEDLMVQVRKGINISLDHVEKLIEQAFLGFERSSGLGFCLENLFLNLGFLDLPQNVSIS